MEAPLSRCKLGKVFWLGSQGSIRQELPVRPPDGPTLAIHFPMGSILIPLLIPLLVFGNRVPMACYTQHGPK